MTLQRRTPLGRSTPFARSSAPIRRVALPPRDAPMPRRRARDAADADRFRTAVIARAGGRCQVCPVLAGSGDPDAIAVARRCAGTAAHAHHVEARGMGGHGNNDPTNGIAACADGHEFVERHRTLGYRLGLLRRHGLPSHPDGTV